MPDATVYFVAGERSGDNHGAALLKALRARVPEMRFVGRGGPKMRAVAGGKFRDWIDKPLASGYGKWSGGTLFFGRKFKPPFSGLIPPRQGEAVLLIYRGFI